jgi:methyl-accepting chemotaxis protein
VTQMDEMTQQNAALVEEAAASSESIVEQVHALNAMVAGYHVGGSVRAAAARKAEAHDPTLEQGFEIFQTARVSR